MRVMVVEDEKRARTLIARLLNLVDPNIQIVGECANGTVTPTRGVTTAPDMSRKQTPISA